MLLSCALKATHENNVTTNRISKAMAIINASAVEVSKNSRLQLQELHNVNKKREGESSAPAIGEKEEKVHLSQLRIRPPIKSLFAKDFDEPKNALFLSRLLNRSHTSHSPSTGEIPAATTNTAAVSTRLSVSAVRTSTFNAVMSARAAAATNPSISAEVTSYAADVDNSAGDTNGDKIWSKFWMLNAPISFISEPLPHSNSSSIPPVLDPEYSALTLPTGESKEKELPPWLVVVKEDREREQRNSRRVRRSEKMRVRELSQTVQTTAQNFIELASNNSKNLNADTDPGDTSLFDIESETQLLRTRSSEHAQSQAQFAHELQTHNAYFPELLQPHEDVWSISGTSLRTHDTPDGSVLMELGIISPVEFSVSARNSPETVKYKPSPLSSTCAEPFSPLSTRHTTVSDMVRSKNGKSPFERAGKTRAAPIARTLKKTNPSL